MVQKVRIEDNLADMETKVVSVTKFKHCLDLLNVVYNLVIDDESIEVKILIVLLVCKVVFRVEICYMVKPTELVSLRIGYFLSSFLSSLLCVCVCVYLGVMRLGFQ